MKIYNAQLMTMTDRGTLANGYLAFENGVITRIEEGMPDTIEAEDLDVHGALVLPGFVDAHTHLGIIEDGLDFEGDDCNEASEPFLPQLRALDGVNPFDRCFEEAWKGGVTTVLIAPGSANACGGSVLAAKTAGTCIDSMMIGQIGMKFALGENPKNVYRDRDETPMTRMATAALIREGLYKARRYLEEVNVAENDPEESMPDYDAKCEALLPLLRKEIKAHFHCHRADDICTAIRIAEEFDLDCVIVHGTEGDRVSDLLKEKEIPVIAGPILCDRSKPELRNLDIRTPHRLQENGILTALCTDHPVVPIQHLSLTASLARKGGMSEEEALRAITCDAAKILGIEDRVGSLAPGLDADFQIYERTDSHPQGGPLDLQQDPIQVYIGGKPLYPASDLPEK